MRDKGRDGGVTGGSLMRVEGMIDRVGVCIASNSINIDYMTGIYQLWEDAYATVRKYMS